MKAKGPYLESLPALGWRAGTGAILLGVFLSSQPEYAVAVDAATSCLTLTWDPSPGPGVAGYKLYYGNASGSYTEALDVGTNLTAKVYSLLPGATNYIVVKAYTSGGLESLPSNELRCVLPPAPASPVAPLAPGAAPVAILDPNPLDTSQPSATVAVSEAFVSGAPAGFSAVRAKLRRSANNTGRFVLTVTGTPGGRYVVQASTDLRDWVSLYTNDSSFTFTDADLGTHPSRFYRLLQPLAVDPSR